MRIRVIENRKIYYALSLVVIGLGILFMIINASKGIGAFSKDIQFTGGSLIQVDMHQPYSTELKDEVLKISKEITGHSKISITSAGTTGLMITMPQTDTNIRVQLFEALKEKYQLESGDLLSDQDISASISKDIKTGAVKAVIVGAILILIYISFRFKDYRLGTSAIIALIHDVLVMFAVYAIFRVPLNNSFIAAMLTIVGYSINDTIVVFDRIRENKEKRGLKEHDLVSPQLIDDSVNQTIGRSLSTSITTLIMIVLLFFLGTTSVKEFSFPLIIGIVSGTYSSIFVAAPVWYDLSRLTSHSEKNQNNAKNKTQKGKKKNLKRA